MSLFIKCGKSLVLCLCVAWMWVAGSYWYCEHYWYHPFLKTLVHKNVRSVRLFQVWVSPFQDGREVSWVGGGADNFHLWKSAVEGLCDSALVYRSQLDFQYQLIVDRKVLHKHHALIQEWDAQYGSMIQWVVWDELPFDSSLPVQLGLSQCTTGCASVCSDFLRFMQIGQTGRDLDIYMDIDTFSQAFRNKHDIASTEALGGMIQEPGMYHTFHASAAHVSYNCDLLIDYKNTPQALHILKQDMSEVLEAYAPLYQHMAQHHERSCLPSLESYLQSLDPLVQWARVNPEKNINQYGLILDGIGPGFWETQLQKGRSLPYRYGFVANFDNYFSWRDRDAYLSYGFQTYEVLEASYDPHVAHIMIGLNLCLYDYIYCAQQDNHPWAALLKQHCIAQWDSIAPSMHTPLRYPEQTLGIMIEQMRVNIL